MMPLPPGTVKPVEVKNNREGIGPAKPVDPDRFISHDETSIILRATLLPEHADDPNVLRFISAYLTCRDTKQAALSIGLKTIDGKNLRSRPDIGEAIRQLTERAVFKHGLDAGEIVEKVKEIAFVDISEFEKEDGTYYESLRDLPPEIRRAVKEFEVANIYGEDPNGMKVVTGKIMKIKLNDKMKSLELLGRETNLFKETTRVEHDVTRNMAHVLLGATDRAAKRQERLVHDSRRVEPTLPEVTVEPTEAT